MNIFIKRSDKRKYLKIPLLEDLVRKSYNGEPYILSYGTRRRKDMEIQQHIQEEIEHEESNSESSLETDE